MARNSRTEGAFFDRMLPFVAAVGFLPAAIGQALTGSMTPTAWLCAAISGVFCGLYFLSLGKAYESADFTTVYPVARSLPVLLVAVGDAFRGAVPTAVGWLGMVLVVGGCLMAPLRSRRDVTLSRYWNHSSFLMVATALGTVGYTLFDKRATEVVQRGPVSAAIYDYYFTLSSFIAYFLLARLPGARGKRAACSGPLWLPALAGMLNYTGYFLVVWAYQMVARASYVIAFRQSSLIMGVLMAFALYPQERYRIRLLAVLVITAGLLLITVFG